MSIILAEYSWFTDYKFKKLILSNWKKKNTVQKSKAKETYQSAKIFNNKKSIAIMAWTPSVAAFLAYAYESWSLFISKIFTFKSGK